MTTLLVIAVAFVTGWFAAGSIWNVRKGNAILKWMTGGLPLVGERTTVRWLGTTSIEMVIAKAKKPFDQVTLVIFLEPRDVPWIWGPSRLRGRRDTLIFRAHLGKPPATDIESFDPASWSGRDARSRTEAERWTVREPQSTGDLPIYYKVGSGLALGESLLGLARAAGMTVRRLSVRRGEPHVQLHIDLPSISAPAAEIFSALHAIGDSIIRS
ncbi:MAG TPA: hypothetical protein VEZ11_13380 [Thermoanaerobaculia bacterium]|nr:hypothetical protein [Thermoanaerobaculia bacterium]